MSEIELTLEFTPETLPGNENGAGNRGKDAETSPGPVERAIDAYISGLSSLSLDQAVYASMARRLARSYDQYDEPDLSKLARINMELRQTISAIEAAKSEESKDPDLSPPTR